MASTRSSQGAHTLEGEYYTTQRIYDLETERIFSRRWLFVGLAAALSDAGSYFLAEFDNDSVIIVRDRDNRIRAFHNVCRHRGTRLCGNAAGAFGKHMVCPYHAWSYTLAGELAAAPNMADVEGFDAANYPLHSVALEVWRGMIFINLCAQPQPFAEAFAPVISRFDRWRIDSLAPVHRTEYEVAANWKLLMQNYSECYHCPTLHPMLNKLTPYRNTSNDLDEGAIVGGPMQLASGMSSMTIDGRACAAPFSTIPPDEQSLVHYYVFFPSLFLSLMPDYVLIHRLIRRGPHLTTVVCQWLFDAEAAAQSDFDPTPAVEFWDTTNRQDWHICEQSHAGINSRGYQPGPYSNLESLLAALDREYLSALGAEAS